jgi:hypothetical protein
MFFGKTIGIRPNLRFTASGEKPMLVYMDTYIKSMRLCYNIAREYDANSEVFGSL